ncbi:MAG: serine/threonine-protein kinase [Gemmatimonadales bacterium]
MADEILTGRTIAGYRLLELVGEGGTAVVYKAEHAERNSAAVKVLKERSRNDQTAVKRFLREAGYGSRIEHPSVVRTYDFGEEDGLYYLALEWAEGMPLSNYVEKNGRMDPELVADAIGQLAEGLMASHAEGIIHRDLKPDNIIFDPENSVLKLLDFGIARDAQQDTADRLTRTGFFVGTLNHVAPEALSGELVDEAADLYSVGTIAYYLLTARHPYAGRTQRELFQQLLTQPPTPLNEVVPGLTFSDELEEEVMKALNRNPQARHKSVREFADALKAAPKDVRGSGQARSRDTSANTEEGGGFSARIRGIFGKKR